MVDAARRGSVLYLVQRDLFGLWILLMAHAAVSENAACYCELSKGLLNKVKNELDPIISTSDLEIIHMNGHQSNQLVLVVGLGVAYEQLIVNPTRLHLALVNQQTLEFERKRSWSINRSRAGLVAMKDLPNWVEGLKAWQLLQEGYVVGRQVEVNFSQRAHQ